MYSVQTVITSDNPTSTHNALNEIIRLDVGWQGGGRTYTDDIGRRYRTGQKKRQFYQVGWENLLKG